jgi:hypothetical protein
LQHLNDKQAYLHNLTRFVQRSFCIKNKGLKLALTI